MGTRSKYEEVEAIQFACRLLKRYIAYNLLLLTTKLLIFCIVYTASDTIPSTISLAESLSLTTAAALPIKNGRALSIISSLMSFKPPCQYQFWDSGLDVRSTYVSHCLEIVFDGDRSLVSQGLHLGLTVFLPVLDILVGSDTERSSSEDDGSDVVVEA